MKVINIHEAKAQLSRLLEQVEAGEEFVIGKYGHPIAKLVPLPKPIIKRSLGRYEGQIWISPDFDRTDAKFNKQFYGGSIEPD